MNGHELGLLRHGLQRTHSPSLHQSGPPIEGPSLSLVRDSQPFMPRERNFSSTWVTPAWDAASSRNRPTIKSRFSSFFDSWRGLARLDGRSIPEGVFSCLCHQFGWFGQVWRKPLRVASQKRSKQVRLRDNVCASLTG